jgi:coenzyme F420-dependent glucose-6-phosphate dehydrogenase
MTQFGLTLSSEEHSPSRLVEIAELAEASDFDFVSISDHFHPWLDSQGHSPNVWPVLGAIAGRTEQIGVVVGVTCPIMRVHPVIMAHLTATTAGLLGERFAWGVGSGEALNEHVLGDRWPPAPERIDMLREAIELIRMLWEGDEITFHGDYFDAENARIYDPPPFDLPIVVSAFGDIAARLAAEYGDGLWTTGSSSESIDTWREAGGTGPVYSQLTSCWAADRDEALDTAERVWPNSGVPGQLSQDLPTPAHFEMASSMVTRDDIAEHIPCGPDLDELVEQARQAIDNGVDHLYFHQIGDDQEGFCEFWCHELRGRLDA